MAQFQIKLLTPSMRNGTTQFLETPMTEFYTQQTLYENKNQLYQADPFIFPGTQTFCYTYNEKLELHQNAQKLLTFSMDRKMFINNAWTTNPFAANIHVGTQLLLIDKYDNEYIFIVTKIDYTNKENNMSYAISCQDLFTYQMTRQNSGYTIENDAESDDFIGVRTIDDWVINFIQPDCFINYTYLTLNQGLYVTNDNQIKTFIAGERLQNVKKVIKPVYADSAYQETIPFAISGSNADAALIALGNEIGFSIATYEHNTYDGDVRSGFFVKYFWFEPTKKADRITGLTFSPKSDVQNFSFSHAGDALTTVLNVEASEGSETEESVSLFPAIPTFFAQYFASQEWQSSSYYTGMFTDLISNKTYILNTNQLDNNSNKVRFPILISPTIYTDFQTAMLENCNSDKNALCFMLDENGYRYLYIPIWLTTSETPKITAVKNVFYISSFYDHVKFKAENRNDANTNHISLTTLDEDNNENILLVDLNDYSSALTLVSRTINQEETTIKYSDPLDCYMDRSVIPPEFLGADQIAFIKITVPSNLIISGINDAYVNITFYRDTSPEEREFAAVADECPWLENKIIDFRYFYNQNIINKYEYNTLTNTFNNDLRIANGNLLLYSQQYYEALHKKTQIVANITADLDGLGAAVYSDILEPYKETGAAASDITAFKNAYELVMQRLHSNNQRSAIVNWSDTLTEYWNKYWNAEQRFLKNIYNFKNYFNMNASIGDEHSAIYRDTIELDSNLNFDNLVDGDPVNYITLTANGFSNVNRDFSLYDTNVNSASYGRPFVTLFKKDNNETLEIVDKSNYKNYYVPAITTDSTYLCDDIRGQYKAWKTYYQYAVVIHTNNPIEIDPSHDYDAFIYQEDSNKAVLVRFYKAENTPIKTYDEDGEHISYDCTYYFLPYTADWFTYTFAKEPRMYIGQTLFQGSQITMELTPVDATYIKTRYLLSLSDEDFNKKHFYARKDDRYTSVKYLPTDMASFLGGLYSKQAILNSAITGRSFIRANKTSEVITTSNISNLLHDFLSDPTTAAPINQGYIVPPINTFYYYGPKVVISDDSTSSATVHRLNSQNQSCDDIRGVEGAENPYNYQDYFKIAYVDASTASSTYRNVASAGCQELSSPWMYGVSAVAAAAGFFVNPFVGILGVGLFLIASINSLCLAFSPMTASTSGVCVGDIAQQRFSGTDEYLASYKEFNYPVYFPTNTSSVDYVTFWKSNNKDDYRDYNLANEPVIYNDGAYWFNFYNLISFNYELLSNPASSWKGNDNLKADIQSDIYYKDKAYQLLSISNDVINNKDKYYLVIVSGEGNVETPYIANYMWKQNGYSLWYNNVTRGAAGYGYVADWRNNYKQYYVSALTQYPFTDRAVALNTSAYDWKGRSSVSVVEFLSSIFEDLRVNGFYGVFYGGLENAAHDSVVFVLREQDETTVPVLAMSSDSSTYLRRSYDVVKNNILYVADTNLEYNALNEPDAVKGLITNYDTNTNYQTPTEFNEKSTYYKLVDGAYYPCYTIWQIISQYDFAVYTDNFLYSIVNLTDDVLSLDLPVYLNQAIFRNLGTLLTITVDNWNLNSETTISYINRAWSINSTNANIAGYEFVLNNFEVQEDGTAILSFSSDTFPTQYRDELKRDLLSIGYREQLIEPSNIEVQSSDRFSLTNIQIVESNSLVHFTVDSILDKENSDRELPITVNQANTVYTTTYHWTGERIASLHNLSNGTFWLLYHNAELYPTLMERAALIETQLQAYWNEAYTASLYCEYFLPEYWQTYADETINYFSGWIYTYDGEKVCLNNQLLPDVQIVTKNGVSQLAAYQLKYRTSKDILNQVNERMTSSQQQVNKTPRYSANDLLSDNIAITNAMHILGENLTNWSAEPLGTATTTYYYANSGGLKWPRALSIFANHNSGDYEDYAGWYILFYRIWKESYKDRSFPLYEQYLTQHNSIWRQLYNNYPGVILENTYSNSNAVSSLDLLKMAQLYFKDLSQPERQYNISIIDVANLDGYDGHELQLGDPIAINAFEYYDDHDEVYQTLLQYMFITDMSYSLRSDGDIQLTVNSIKYQDKLIQNLAKLIK